MSEEDSDSSDSAVETEQPSLIQLPPMAELEQARAAQSQRVAALGLKTSEHVQHATVFLFAGEGVHSADMDIASLKSSPAWDEVEAALEVVNGASLETFLLEGESHRHPPTISAAVWRTGG